MKEAEEEKDEDEEVEFTCQLTRQLQLDFTDQTAKVLYMFSLKNVTPI